MSDVPISWKDLFFFNYVIQLPHFLRLPTDLQLGKSHPEKLWCCKKKSNYSLGKPLVKVDLQRMHRNKLPYFVCLTIEKKGSCLENIYNKNAFQYDAYHPLVARISQHALLRGVYLPGGVPAQGVYLPGGGAPAQVSPPDRILDTRY